MVSQRTHNPQLLVRLQFPQPTQGDSMSEIKSNTKKVPNVPIIKNIGPKSAIKPKGPIGAKTAKPLRKAGRGR